MKKITGYAVYVSLLTSLCVSQFSCGKTTEKTTTIIKEKEKDDDKDGVDVEFKIKGNGISIDANKK